MSLRVCTEPGCPVLGKSTRCPDHTRERDQARGTRQQRGYGAEYDRERKQIADALAQGRVLHCWRCGRTQGATSNWCLGHCDDDRSVTHGIECAACNYSTARRRGQPCPHPSHRP